ncbi:MAG: hypothetical protein FWD78_04810 [Treponema sp.]|nr:hypothetical protein [Treponema sp.]
MKINSVTGPIDTSSLGTTLIHEHVTFGDWSMRANFGARVFDFDRGAAAAQNAFLKMKRECGIATVVDGTPVNLGRDVNLVREAAVRTGVNFIVSSGFYYQTEPWLEFLPEDLIYDLLMGECVNGIGDTGIKPGIMKAAVESEEITPYLNKILSAAARVAAKTGLPVFCHHKPANKNGGRILDIFESRGVPLNKFILGHCGDTDNLDYLQQMLDRGCYIGMDRFGYCGRLGPSLEKRAAAIVKLRDRGYIDKMFLSHDLAAYLGVLDELEKFLNLNPEEVPDFTFIHKKVLPALLALGLTGDEFGIMMEKNPRKFFEA